MDTTQMTALPLDIDLNSVDTSFPLIANGAIVDLNIEKIEAKSSGGGQPMLNFTFKTTTPVQSVKGDVLPPGVTVFHNIMLVPVGKATAQMVVQNIAELTQGFGFSGNLGDFVNGGYQTLQGKVGRAKIAFIAEGPDKKGVNRKAKNEISSFIKQ